MFFWGLGTSKISTNSFGWEETAAAAALAGEEQEDWWWVDVLACHATGTSLALVIWAASQDQHEVQMHGVRKQTL